LKLTRTNLGSGPPVFPPQDVIETETARVRARAKIKDERTRRIGENSFRHPVSD